MRKKTNAMYLIGAEMEDLLQEGMIGLFKGIRDFQQEKGVTFYHFAELCINRQIYSAVRNSNRKKNIPLNTAFSIFVENGEDGFMLDTVLMDEEMNPENMIIEQEFRQNLWKKLDERLSKMERQVLDRYLEGASYTEIAEQMQKKPKSIDNTLQRIRKKIREMDEKEGV